MALPRGAWVIYDEQMPGVPGRYVARKFFVGQVFIFDAGDEFRADELSVLRKLLPSGLVNVGRQDGDSNKVVETWA